MPGVMRVMQRWSSGHSFSGTAAEDFPRDLSLFRVINLRPRPDRRPKTVTTARQTPPRRDAGRCRWSPQIAAADDLLHGAERHSGGGRSTAQLHVALDRLDIARSFGAAVDEDVAPSSSTKRSPNCANTAAASIWRRRTGAPGFRTITARRPARRDAPGRHPPAARTLLCVASLRLGHEQLQPQVRCVEPR